jgi:hypothetical protein
MRPAFGTSDAARMAQAAAAGREAPAQRMASCR